MSDLRLRTVVLSSFALLSLFCLPLPAAFAQTPPAASSSAFGEWVSIQLLPLLGSPVQVASGPLPAVSGSAYPLYDQSKQAASAQVSVPGLGNVLQTGVLMGNAASPVPIGTAAMSDTMVVSVQVRLAAVLSLLNLSADAVSSKALVYCPCVSGTAVSGGMVNLAKAKLNGLSLDVHPAPNTVLLDVAGLRVVLNEQILDVQGYDTELTVNAVHISLDALPIDGVGVLTGDIILAQSRSEVRCFVPE